MCVCCTAYTIYPLNKCSSDNVKLWSGTIRIKTATYHFPIRTVHLDIIKVLFIHQLMHQWVVLKNNIKIYNKTAPTCFGVTVTSSSGSALICAQNLHYIRWQGEVSDDERIVGGEGWQETALKRDRNGRSSWERQGIVTFCTCRWNEWMILACCIAPKQNNSYMWQWNVGFRCYYEFTFTLKQLRHVSVLQLHHHQGEQWFVQCTK